MKILILGGNGFIGSNLGNYISSIDGMEIYSFDMYLPSYTNPRIKYITGDFFDDYVIQNSIIGMDVIIHAICTLNPGNSNEKFILGYERDLIQTIKLCEYAKTEGARIIFLSSGGTVYGVQDYYPVSEDARTVPINHYGNLKLCIENVMRVFNYQLNQSMIIARISNPYGPGQNYLKGVGFIDAIIKRAVQNEPIEIWGDGNIIRDYIYIEDVCKMIFSLVKYKGKYEVFNISSGIGRTQNDIIASVRLLIPHIEVKYLPPRKVDVSKIVLDNRRIMGIVDINLTSLDEGIRRHYDYIMKNRAI